MIVNNLWHEEVSEGEILQIIHDNQRLYCAGQAAADKGTEADETRIIVASSETGEKLTTLTSPGTGTALSTWIDHKKPYLRCCTTKGSIITFDLTSEKLLHIEELPRADDVISKPPPTSLGKSPINSKSAIYRRFTVSQTHSILSACSSDSNNGSITVWKVNQEGQPKNSSREPASGGAVELVAQKPVILTGHEAGVLSIAFSHDGSLLFSGSYDHSIRVWSTSSWRCIKVLKGHGGGVRALVVSHDSRVLYSAAADNTMRAWSTEIWVCLRNMHGRHEDTTWTSCMDIGPRETQAATLLASGSTGPFGASTLKMFNAVDGECLVTFAQLKHDQRGGISALAFSNNGDVLYSAASDGTVAAWTLDTSAKKEPAATLRRGFFS